MFSRVSKQLWSLGRAGGSGRGFSHCAYEIQKRTQGRKAGCTKACRCLAQVSYVSQVLQWPW